MSVDLLKDQPQEYGELVFHAPWQARTFALAVKLHESGLFTWKEWSDRLSHNIADFEVGEEVISNDDYYTLWQHTLEQLVFEKEVGV